MSSIWRIPPAAFFLGIFIYCGGLVVGGVIGEWILPMSVALAHGGWPEVLRIPISERVFAEAPAFLDPQSGVCKMTNVGRIIFLLAGAGFALRLAQRWWEYLVITKYKWMTRKEVEEFYKRDPGY